MDLLSSIVGDSARQATLRTWGAEGPSDIGWAELLDGSARVAGALVRRGIDPGTFLPVVLTNTAASARGLLAGWWAGARVASLPVPARGMHPREYGSQIEAAAERLGVEMVVADDPIAEMLAETTSDGVRVASWTAIGQRQAIEPDAPSGDDLAFVQYSSGSTGQPKGCMLSATAIASQLEILDQIVDVRGEYSRHRLSAWIPLSHDMGLFACLLWALSRDVPTLLGSPERFVRSPGTWLQDAVDWSATITVGPPTALALATRMARIRPPRGALDAIERWVLAAERIDWSTLIEAREVLAPHGLRFESLMPAYGMAEVAAGVTGTSSQEEPSFVSLDGAALAGGEVVPATGDGATEVVCVGPPVEGVDARIIGGGAGEIAVRSPSLAQGYLGETELTRERFHDGELRTRDLGFKHEGAFYVVGRMDDVLMVAGRNVHAEEVEAAIGALDGIRERGCVLLEGEGARLMLVAEAARTSADRGAVAAKAGKVAMEVAGVPVESVVFVRGGSLPRTPSGKLQRFRCRELLYSGGLAEMQAVQIRGAGAARDRAGADQVGTGR